MSLKIVINKSDFKFSALVLILCIELLIPAYFSELISGTPLLGSIISYTSLLVMALIIIDNPIKPNFPFAWVIGYYVILLISTVMSDGDVVPAVIFSATAILLCLTIAVILRSERKTKIFLYTVMWFTFTFFIVNIILGFIYPSGIPGYTTNVRIPMFLYGNINGTLRNILPGMICSTIMDIKYRKRISLQTIIFYAGMFYFIFGVYFMATAFIGLLYIIAWKLFNKVISKRVFVFFLITIIIVAVIELLMVFGLGNTQLSMVISSFFGKSLTFSGRAELWYRAIAQISEKPFLGWGYRDGDYIRSVIGNTAGSHNYYLDLLFQRGIIGLIWFCVMIFYICKRVSKNISHTLYVLIGFIGAYMIMFLAEPFINMERFHIALMFVVASVLCDSERVSEK